MKKRQQVIIPLDYEIRNIVVTDTLSLVGSKLVGSIADKCEPLFLLLRNELKDKVLK